MSGVKELAALIYKNEQTPDSKPYREHALEVAKEVATLGYDRAPGSILIAAAMLSGAMDQVGLSDKAIYSLLVEYGVPLDRAQFITDLVYQVSDPGGVHPDTFEQQCTWTRERIAAKRVSYTSEKAQAIKAYDRIIHLRNMNGYALDPQYKERYFDMSADLLGIIYSSLQGSTMPSKILADVGETLHWVAEVRQAKKEKGKS